MKIVINCILGVCAAVLLWLCYESIMAPIHFNEEKSIREAAVKERLILIKNIEEQYRQQHQGEFCDSFHVMIDFIKNGRIPMISKVGELSDDQMSKGLTEAKASAIVKSGDAAAIAANGLQNFRRDTTWVALADTLLGKDFVADSIQYIPYSNGEKFELEKTIHVGRSGVTQNVMECRAPYSSYLKGMNEREIYNLTDMAEKQGRYPGLKIGDITSPNNNAGNWE